MPTTFRPDEHIRRRRDFEAVYESGAKVSGRLMTVFALRRTSGPCRLGVAATRKIGGAVVRNRAKRLARELFRRHKPTAELDLVIVPRREFPDAPYLTLEREFGLLLERAARGARLPARDAVARPVGRRPRRAGGDSRV